MLARLSLLSLLAVLILPFASAMPFFGYSWGSHDDDTPSYPTLKPDYTYAFPTYATPTAGPTGTGTGAPYPTGTDFKGWFARRGNVERGYYGPKPTWGVYPTGMAGTGTATGYPWPTATGWSKPKYHKYQN
ncbi:hypothetical protein W97_03096 [Coniosporium apollinis CBS 100218]|uniref:Uncharacterized protein n=1 Tax=Coniosporium apollinis (strain CBS 100218) TaxID=1168221 RepID=R7YPU3_CONA1|nr:uncharacterized protein W97_03096 [Coniosporium apollinis CBS 100218]EON63868.1 hypothetical protein W97_03096 [Coniosporium apollinis CBS 100218]